MQYSLMATLAASALAIGIGFGPAAAFSPIAKIAAPESLLLNVQRGERGAHAGKGEGIRTGRARAGKGHRARAPAFRSGARREGARSGNRGRGTAFRSGNRRGHARHGGSFGVYVGPGYGYSSECDWMRRRALATGSSYWWRRYRACV